MLNLNRKESEEAPISGREIFLNHFLLFGHLFLAREKFADLRFGDKKQIRLALFNTLGIAIFLALLLQITADGPEFLHEYYRGNFAVYSQLLLGPAWITTVFFFGIVLVVAVILPYILNTFAVNHSELKLRKDPSEKHHENRPSRTEIFVCSMYAILPILFYYGAVYSIVSVVFWSDMKYIQLQPLFFEVLYYCFGALVLLSIWGFVSLGPKVLSLKRKAAILEGVMLFGLLALLFVLFFVF